MNKTAMFSIFSNVKPLFSFKLGFLQLTSATGAGMENDNEQQMTEFWLKKQSIISWIKSAWSSSGFSFQSLLIRQVLAAVSGLLVNLLITPLVVCFIDEDFGSSSLKRTLLVSLVSMLLAYIFRHFRKVKKRVQSQNCDTSSWMDGINNPTGEEISNDYSVFTCFRFPVPEIMGPLKEEKGDDEDKKTWPETLHPEEQVQSSSLSSKLVGSSSLSESRPTQPPLLQPSYQQQSVKSDPPSSSSPYAHHQWFLPSAPPLQAMKEKTKLKNSRRSRQPHAQSKKQKAGSLHCLLHKSLFHPSYLQAEYSASLPRYPKQEVNTNSLPDRSVTRISREKAPRQASRLQQSLRAWKFMEEANFEKFKSDFARFRSMNNVDSGRNYKASWRAKLDANERRKEAQKPAPIQQVMTESNGARRPAPIQIMTTESNGGRRPAPFQIMTTESNCRRKSVDKGNRKKGGGCVKRFLSSICIQILGRKRKQSQWNSRRFKQIADAPFSSSSSNYPW